MLSTLEAANSTLPQSGVRGVAGRGWPSRQFLSKPKGDAAFASHLDTLTGGQTRTTIRRGFFFLGASCAGGGVGTMRRRWFFLRPVPDLGRTGQVSHRRGRERQGRQKSPGSYLSTILCRGR